MIRLIKKYLIWELILIRLVKKNKILLCMKLLLILFVKKDNNSKNLFKNIIKKCMKYR